MWHCGPNVLKPTKEHKSCIFKVRSLTYQEHYNNIISKARQKCNGLRSIGFVHGGLLPATGIRLFTSLVYPTFEYGSQILRPAADFLDKAETIQSIYFKKNSGLRTQPAMHVSDF